MTEERRAEQGALAAALSGERSKALRPVEDGDEISVEEGEPESATPPTEPNPSQPPTPAEPARKVASSGEPPTGRRMRMTLRIPDDEVARPSSPPLAAPADGAPVAAARVSVSSPPDPPPPDAPPIAATRIITIGPPAPDPLDETDETEESWSAAATIHDVSVHDTDDDAPSSMKMPVMASTGGPEPARPVSAPRAKAPSAPDIPVDFDVDALESPPAAASDVEAEPSGRASEPGVLHEVSPEDVVSVESAPSKGLQAKSRSKSVPPAAPAGSNPQVKAARPAPPPAPRPLVIMPTPSPIAPPPMTDAAAAARKKARPWWEDLFNDDYIRTMAKIDDSQIATEVDFIEDSLGVAKGAMVLDLACGTGRHAIEFTRRGYQVVGFDLSLAMLARAADEAQDRNQKLNFVQGDMREMTFEGTFDGVYSWNTSFGYFEEEKNAIVVSNVRRALKPAGLFLLDVVNRDFLARQAPSLAWFEGDGCVCMDEMHVDWITSRMRIKRTMMMDDGRSKEIEYSVRVYSLHELGKLLHDSGFRVVEVSGRTATPGVFFGADSPRTLILAEKR